MQDGSIEQFSGDIAILKKYLLSKGAPTEAIKELYNLCHDTEKRSTAAAEKIANLLEQSSSRCVIRRQ